MKQFLLFLMLVFPLAALAAKTSFNSTAIFVKSIDSGNIILEKNQNIPRPYASLTKLFTGMCVFDKISDASFQIPFELHDLPTVKRTRSHLKFGVNYSQVDLLYYLLSSSDNGAAYLISRSIFGSIDKAVECMNASVTEYGSIKLVEPSGLSPLNVGSAKDLANFIIEQNVSVLETFSTENIIVRNTNALIRNGKKDWFLLSKTGYISESGYNFAGIMITNDKRYAVVLLGAKSKNRRLSDLIKINKILNQNIK